MLDLEPIKTQWIPVFEHYGRTGWNHSNVIGHVIDLIAEVERLRAEMEAIDG